MYEYNAKVIRVVDGDTIICEIDHGMRITSCQTLRLARINAPEMRKADPAGLEAKLWLTKRLVEHNCEIRITTGKSDSFDRWIAEVYLGLSRDHRGLITVHSLNDEMVRAGHAVYRKY